jgi:hypothetical protein
LLKANGLLQLGFHQNTNIHLVFINLSELGFTGFIGFIGF